MTRAARIRQVFRGPRDVLLLARMLAWAAALPVLKRRWPLTRLVEAAVPAQRPPNGSPRMETVITVARWIYRLPTFRDNCLERSLLTYRYLPESTRRYRLVLGVRLGEEDGPPGHAWLTVDGVPVHDSTHSLAHLTPILAFDEAGRRDADLEGAPATAGPPEPEEGGAETRQKPERPPGPG